MNLLKKTAVILCILPFESVGAAPFQKQIAFDIVVFGNGYPVKAETVHYGAQKHCAVPYYVGALTVNRRKSGGYVAACEYTVGKLRRRAV